MTRLGLGKIIVLLAFRIVGEKKLLMQEFESYARYKRKVEKG